MADGQIAVDEATQLIIATGLTRYAADYAELLSLIDHTHATQGAQPAETLVDAGHRGEATLCSTWNVATSKKAIDANMRSRYPDSRHFPSSIGHPTEQSGPL